MPTTTRRLIYQLISLRQHNRIMSLFALLCCYLTTSPSLAQETTPPGIIPIPVSIERFPGNFSLSGSTVITWSNEEDAGAAEIFVQTIKERFSLNLTASAFSHQTADVIQLQRTASSDLPPEGYRLSVNDRQVMISAGSGAGIFYALQSLLQCCHSAVAGERVLVAQLKITDYPRFSWRGMHLDVARHFFSVAEVKQYLDYLAAYKFNTFHWHLTDDQGWRIEIKRYPRLTETGAWRNGTLIGHYSDNPQFDSIPYGGYYTQDEIKEVISYAQERFINIVPEIEMPGHVTALLAAYPELSCNGNAIAVAKNWGVFNDVLCPTEQTISFMKDVLQEVINLFPSSYIHIGGDECPKEQWKNSRYCQNLIRQLGLPDEEALQGYFTQQIADFISEKGRKMIGWDEILHDGLTKNAAIMSWRGFDGGVKAANMQHEVVMVPTDFCYFDYYQSPNANEPLAIGGFIPLEKVYAFEPVPPALETSEQSFIIGGQANVWTEYISSFSKLQYMIFPRMCAMSEVLWSKKENRNYLDFTTRLTTFHFPLFNALNINYSKALLQVKMEVRPNSNGAGVIVRLSSDVPQATINYNLSSYENEILSATNNTRFEKTPIDLLISRSIRLNTIAKDVAGNTGPELVQQFQLNLATGKPITFARQPDPKYGIGGSFTLVNGINGRIPWNGSEWLGFSGDDLDAIIDLGALNTVSHVTLGLLNDEGSWIYLPAQVTVALSDDGKTFHTAGSRSNEAISKEGGRHAIFSFNKTTARYIRIVAQNIGTIPAGKAGAGHPAWLFADEISVE